MHLSIGDFSLFNLKSKTILLEYNGLTLMRRQIDNQHEARLILIFGFYVEACIDLRKNRILHIEPMLKNNWIEMYYQ